MKYQSKTGVLKEVRPGYRQTFWVSQSPVSLGGRIPWLTRSCRSSSPTTVGVQEFTSRGGRPLGRLESAPMSWKLPVAGVWLLLGAITRSSPEKESGCNSGDGGTKRSRKLRWRQEWT